MTAERERLEQAIAALEAQRVALGDAVVDTALASLREKLAALQAQPAPDPPDRAQRKQVTVLFADVSGFTAMSETMDPEEVRDLMNALWRRLDGIIAERGGLIDKHIGDAVMALFGAPTAREDDAERAIRAALALQEELAGWAIESHPSSRLTMRVGINTGPVLLGEVGTTAEYTAIGDTVNLASRLEQAAPVGGVLISHATYRHVRGLFDVQSLEPLAVKGKAEPVQVYRVQRAKPRAFRVPTRGVEGIETRMVGRGDELGRLQEALQAVLDPAQRRTRVVTVSGEAGIGKSRLLYEFSNWLELLPQALWLFKGRADRQRGRLPYALIRDLFAFRFEIQDSDRAAVAREKLERGITRFVGDGPEGHMRAHFIGHLIGFDFSASPHLRGILDDARQVRDRAFHYVVEFFRAVAAEGPAVIFLEDIQWADDGSLDLIDHLARECRDAPLLILCLARPSLFERRPAWGEAWPAHGRLALRRLSASDSQRLVAEILRKAEAVPPILRELVVSRAEGNPFYVEELIKMLIEDGVILTDAERWRVVPERLARVQVPPTLTGVLQARLDRLPPPERETLQRATVVGRVFWDRAVAHLRVPEPEPAPAPTDQLLGALRRREMIFGREPSAFAGTQEYVFKHTILHQVAYESVLIKLRRRYHARVAAWLIEWSGERVSEYAGLIGEHYERAEENDRAAKWYGRAGKQARDTYAIEAALDYYHRALAFLPALEAADAGQAAQQVALYEGQGDVLRWQARFTEALEAFRTMVAAAERAGNRVAQARAWNELAQVQDLQADYHGALESGKRAEDLARAAGAPARVALARALFRRGWELYRLREAESALELAQQALAFSTDLDARREMSHSLNLLGVANQMLGRHEKADQFLEQALASFRASGDRRMVAGVLNNLGVGASLRGDYGRAIDHYREALDIAREIGSREGEMVFLSNLGGMRVRHGEFQKAEADLRQVVRIAEAGGSNFPEAYCFLAEACLGQDKVDEALVAARQALQISREVGERETVGVAWRLLGMVATRRPEPLTLDGGALDAASCFAESLRLLADTADEAERARTLRAWAAFELARGDQAQGRAMWQEAREIFARLDLAPEVERMDRDRM